MRIQYILFILCLIAIAPASAALINVTILFNNRPTTDIQPTLVQINQVTTYIFTSQGNSITAETIFLPQGINGQTIRFALVRNTNQISGTIQKQSTGSFSGNMIVSFDGGSSRTIPYASVPCIGACPTGSSTLVDTCPSVTLIYAGENATSNRYIIAVPTSELTGYANFISPMTTVLTTGDIDTTTDAYILLTTPLSSAPVYSVSLQSANSLTFSADFWYESQSSTLQNEEAVSRGMMPINQDPDTAQTSIFVSILSAIVALASFLKSISSYVITVGAIAVFVLGAKVFLTIVAAYTIIAAILSIHDSDSLITSVGKFIRLELKLWRFFMEIFVWMKELIKWW